MGKGEAGHEKKRARTEQSLTVPKKEIAANDYDLSASRYREALHEHVACERSKRLIRDLQHLIVRVESCDG